MNILDQRRCENTIPRFLYSKQAEIIEKVRETFLKLRYKFYETGNFNLNLIGIRNKNISTNTFNDAFLLIYRNNYGQFTAEIFPCTTDPGTFSLLNPLNPNGTAILVPNQYRGSHSIGIHRAYTALIQSSTLKVYRDNTKDEIMDMPASSIHTDATGINIHHAGPYSLTNDPTVNNWSAGCQVLQYQHHHEHLMKICQLARELYGNLFTYTLLDESQLPA